MDQKIIDQIEAVVGKEGYSVEPAVLYTYGFDASIFHNTPDIVVQPRTTEQVSEVMKIAHANRIPVTPRGVRKQMPSPGARSCAPSSVNVPPETPATRPTRSPTAFGVSNDATPARFPSKK